MTRLDVRAKTRLEARICNKSNTRKPKETVVVKELSLSGALIEGSPPCGETVSIIPDLPYGKSIELEGDVVWVENGMAGLRFNCHDLSTMEVLWKNIQNEIHADGLCPYCNCKNPSMAACCQECGSSLAFDAENYLLEHFRRTFPTRITRRVDKLDAGCLDRILRVVDKEILRAMGQPPEDEFVGTSPAMLEVFSMIRKVAPTEVNVLILGESGTGKELTARAIHERSHRRDKPFVAINSAAIPDGLLEAELFGHEKGAFTGAISARGGKFEQADGGTLFLDEVGDLSACLQSKLLRFLEDRIVERIGARGGRKVDVRIVAATNGNLREMVANGHFREDLYYRLDGFNITLPPLRHRGEDKVIIANYIANRISRVEGTPRKGFSCEALDAIRGYRWPGNVRELINKVRRGILMASGDEIQPVDMGLSNILRDEAGATMRHEISTAQKSMVERALLDNGYVVARAAKELGISRPSLYALMKKYNLSKEDHPKTAVS